MERMEREGENDPTISVESQPTTTKKNETGTASVFFKTSADVIQRPVTHTTSPKPVSVPFTSATVPPHPEFVPISWLYPSLIHGSTDQPRGLPTTLPPLPPPLLPRNPPTPNNTAANHRDNPGVASNQPPLRPNIRTPSTIPIDGETPRSRRLTPMVHT